MNKPNWVWASAIAIAAAAVFASASAAAQGPLGVSIRRADSSRDGRDVQPTRIVVDGPSTLRYDRVINRELDIWAAVTVERMLNDWKFRSIFVSSEDTVLEFPTQFGTRRYKLTIPYVDPQSPMVVNQRNSPIALCNARLAALAGADRQAFLRSGATIPVSGAYTIRLTARGFGNDSVEAPVTAQVECRALGRPRPRTQTTTTGAPSRTGQRREPPAPPPPPRASTQDEAPPRASTVQQPPLRAPAIASTFDVSFRRVDREGNGGATQIWLYNAGPDVARDCAVTANGVSPPNWQTFATTDLAPNETRKLDSPVPASANQFQVACADEPPANRGNNTAVLP